MLLGRINGYLKVRHGLRYTPHMRATRGPAVTGAGLSMLPPYTSFGTFLAFLERLEEALPQRIDRSYWSQFLAPGHGGQVTAAFRFLELIDSLGHPMRKLEELVRDPQSRKEALSDLIFERYLPALDGLDLDRATMDQLEEAFGNVYAIDGDTRRKAVSFFVHAVLYCGLTLSPHITKNTRRRSRRRGTGGRAQLLPTGTHANAPPRTTRTIRFGGGGSISLTVAVDVFSLGLREREFCLEIIDTFRRPLPQSAPLDGENRNAWTQTGDPA